jgi:hypothetical protein
MMNQEVEIARPARSGRGLAWLGLGLALLGVLLYVIQLSLKILVPPWYLPVLTGLGVIALLGSVWRARTVWRLIGLVLVAVLASLELIFLFAPRARVPPYSGPVAVGKPFPAFSTTLADGSSFTRDNLIGKENTVMVFFRGRW